MTILLTADESEKLFLDSLCNGISCGVFAGYGLILEYDSAAYQNARNYLKGEGENNKVSREEVWMQILINGGVLKIKDGEGSEETVRITLADVHTKVQKAPTEALLDALTGNDDSNTADAILQTVFFGEIKYG